MGQSIPPIQRFWKYTQKGDDCWEWVGAKTNTGYGVLNVGGRTVCAHRFAYEHYREPIPAGMHADHLCFNRACVNPSHIQVVTPSVNAQRRSGVSRGNKASGARGVHKNGNRWIGRFTHEGTTHYLGNFKTIEEAAHAVEAERMRLDVEQRRAA